MKNHGDHTSVAGGLKNRFLTPKELAELLRISLTGVYRLVDGRKITFHRVEGVLRFDAQDVEAFLRQGRVEPMEMNMNL